MASQDYVDQLDRGIIEILQNDTSITNKDIGDQLGISEVTVATRIRAMEDRRVLRVMMQRDMRAAGYHFMALVYVNVQGRRPEDVAAELALIDECMSISLAMSNPDIVINVVTRDAAALLALVETRIAAIEGIGSYETMPAMEVVKLDNRFGAVDAS